MNYNNDKKVFIYVNGEYREITYSEFRQCMEAKKQSNIDTTSGDRPFSERYFISIDNTLLEVTQEQYIDYYKDKRRQKYIYEEAYAAGEFSVDALSEDSFNGEVIFVDTAPDVCDTVIKQILTEKVHDALARLPKDERELIVKIYFESRTERQLAKEYSISQVAVNKKKNKILAKLKQFMNF